MYGDFEDLETGEVHKAEHKGDSESDDKGEESDDNQATKDNVEEIAFDRRLERKKKMKAAFDALYPLVLFYIFPKSFSVSRTCKAGGRLTARLTLKKMIHEDKIVGNINIRRINSSNITS